MQSSGSSVAENIYTYHSIKYVEGIAVVGGKALFYNFLCFALISLPYVTLNFPMFQIFALLLITLEASPAPLFFGRPNWYVGFGSGGPFLGLQFGNVFG